MTIVLLHIKKPEFSYSYNYLNVLISAISQFPSITKYSYISQLKILFRLYSNMYGFIAVCLFHNWGNLSVGSLLEMMKMFSNYIVVMVA